MRIHAIGRLVVVASMFQLLGCQTEPPEQEKEPEEELKLGPEYKVQHWPEDCDLWQEHWPGDETDGFLGGWMAARLTPLDYPFLVSSVYLDTRHGPSGVDPGFCDATLPKRLAVWVGSEEQPAATPDPVLVELNDLQPPDSGQTYLETVVPLATAIRIEGGEHLFVALELVGTYNGDHTSTSTCTYSCVFDGWEDTRSWITGDAEAPHEWQTDVAAGSTDSNLDFGAIGNVIIE